MTATGTVLGGRYRLDEIIGDGGTATVWRAQDQQLGVSCAVKVLKLQGAEATQLRSRLRDEVAAMSRVLHPNILRVFDNGEDEGLDWIAMELSEEGSVADRVRDGGPLPARRALQVVLQVLHALEASHGAGVVHRDVKPDNILLQSDGTVRLCDFGIALLDDHTRVTRSGFAMGSLPYMAPEQRVDAHTVGPAADLYATAATLFFLLTASTPVDLFLAPPSSPRFAGLPEGLVELIRRGTHADPKKRFADAVAMRTALEACLQHASDEAVIQPSAGAYEAAESVQSSRIDTAIPVEERSLDALEVELQRNWMKEEAEARRLRNARTSRLVLAGVFTLLAVGVAVFGRISLDDWIERAETQREAVRVPVAGTWRGTFGNHEATLVLEGQNTQLGGRVEVALGRHVLRAEVAGAVQDGFLVLVDEGDEVRRGTYKATISEGARLDGSYDDGKSTEPFHMVRVTDPEAPIP